MKTLFYFCAMRKLENRELNRIDVEAFKKADKLPVIVILDNIRSLNNIGSVFRTSDAFLLDSIYLCGITATPPHKEIHKTALGAEDSMHWEYFETTEEAVEKARANNYTIFSVEQAENALMLDETDLKAFGNIALIFGNEVRGVQQSIVDLSDNCIEIPQFGTKHSLNISVSAGVVMWEVSRQLRS